MSTAKLEECTKINRKIETPPSANARKPNQSAEAQKERTNRYRPAILYDSDDDNTSNPKLEKAIEQDKERIEEERKQWLEKKRAKTPNQTNQSKSREEKSKHKMESSSDKFKKFLKDDIADDDQSPDKGESTGTNAKRRRDDAQRDDDIVEVIEVKDKVSMKTTSRDSSSSSQATGSKSPAPVASSPHQWRTRVPAPSNDQSPSVRRRRISSSDEESTPNDRAQLNQILRGVVFAISGIQVHNFLLIIFIFIRMFL